MMMPQKRSHILGPAANSSSISGVTIVTPCKEEEDPEQNEKKMKTKVFRHAGFLVTSYKPNPRSGLTQKRSRPHTSRMSWKNRHFTPVLVPHVWPRNFLFSSRGNDFFKGFRT